MITKKQQVIFNTEELINKYNSMTDTLFKEKNLINFKIKGIKNSSETEQPKFKMYLDKSYLSDTRRGTISENIN